MASHKSSDDSSSTPPARPIRRNASELDVASLLTSPIDEGQTVVGMATASKVPEMFDFATVDVSSMLTGISAAAKPNVMLDFAKVDISSMLTGISAQSLLGDPDFLEELDEIFTQLPENELLLAEASDGLKPFISFEHNETARRMLQVIVAVSILSALIVIYSISPWAALASACGTPSAKTTWKATGTAYDRLYGIKDYHPNKALERGTPSTLRGKARRTTKY